jgi:hypothetical protein
MKVKIFQAEGPKFLEDEINKWLAAEQPGIIRIIQSSAPAGNVRITTITFLYYT